MTRNQTIIAVLQNAIVYLWNGKTRDIDQAYHDRPVYVCHAIAQGFAHILRGDRSTAQHFLANEPKFGEELSNSVLALIPGYSTADSYCRQKGVRDVQAFRLNMLKSLLATYQAKEAKPVKASELARATLLTLHRPQVPGHPGRESFVCHALTTAVKQFEAEGRTGAEQAKHSVLMRIAYSMGMDVDKVGDSAYSARVARLLGHDFVDAQPRGWMQEQRANMLTRAAEYLEAMGN